MLIDMTNVTRRFVRLDAITAELAPIEQRRDKLREEAAQIAVELLKAGAAPSEVARRSPFSAAHLRTLARIAGLPPARRGGGPKAASK